MADEVLTSKCCFVSFCDKCIRDYIITQSKCVCGVKVLADSLIPNPTLRSTISNMLGTRVCSTASSTGKQRSSAGSNPDPKSQSHTTSAALETDTKQSSPASPDARLQVASEGDQVDRPQKNSDLKSNTEGSAGRSAEKAVASADLSKLKDVSESTLKNGTISSGTLEPKVAKTDQLKKKRKKADSCKAVHPNNADYGYNVPFDPAYCNPFNDGCPMGPFGVAEPYMYGPMGVPYGGYPMGPFGVDPFGNIPPQALAMQGYPPNYQSWETQAAAHCDAEADARSRQVSHGNADGAARSRQTERPNDSGAWPRPPERNQRMGSPQGRELRDRPSQDLNHQSATSACVLLTAESPGTGPGQDQNHQSAASTWVPHVAESRGTGPSQDRRGVGTMGVPIEVPVTTMRITMTGRECARLLQLMVIQRAHRGSETVLGASEATMIATMSRISRGSGDDDDQSPWMLGSE